MRSFRNILAAMLICLTFAAFQSDAGAQTRRSSSSDSSRSSSVRSSGNSRSRVSRSSSAARPSNTETRPSGQSRPSAVRPSSSRPSSQSRPAQISRPGRPTDRPSGRPGQHNPSVRPDDRPGTKPQMGHGPQKPVQVRPDHRHEPPRIHPRDRDFMRWDKPGYFWSRHDHCYGHRVRVLPSHVIRHIFYGHTYYCYNDIWYRPYGSHYIVCRPPYGTVLAANLVADMAWAAVNMAYYTTVVQTYSQINENNEYIAQQNAIIAQNNALIAAQNQTIAQGQQLAQTSYTLANSLGLVQSYAAAGTDYYYQDGVFYAKDASGQYKIIVPPAGALVESLPEDYDMVTLSDGKEYYKVDDTIYQVTISDGKPYFEVLGQQM